MSKPGSTLHVCAIALCAWVCTAVHAGGPWGIYNGAPILYIAPATVALNYDQGSLGSRSKAQADALVAEAVSLWTNVTTATVSFTRGADLPVDVTDANYGTYLGTPFVSISNDGRNPVVYDSDGSITDLFFGAGAKNNLLGFAGSSYSYSGGTAWYTEGRALINGFKSVSDTTLKVVMAHEMGHMIGLDHAQIDSAQGLTSSNYPLMYPIAYRGSVSLHEDEISAVSSLYPDSNVTSSFGTLSGTFAQANGTPIRGANLWVQESSTLKLYSNVSDYLEQTTGYFKFLLPPGTYTLHAQAIKTAFTGGSGIGPYTNAASDFSFQSPLYVSSAAMAPLTLGSGAPTTFTIVAGCAATVNFKFDGTGNVGGNCDNIPGAPTGVSITAGSGSVTVRFTAPANAASTGVTSYTVSCTAAGQTTRTASASASPITVGGLTAGVSYSCTVSASNGTTTGAASSPVIAQPRSVDLTPILLLLLD